MTQLESPISTLRCGQDQEYQSTKLKYQLSIGYNHNKPKVSASMDIITKDTLSSSLILYSQTVFPNYSYMLAWWWHYELWV